MNKKLIRLTESDLHRIVKESVNKVLTELDWKTYQNAAKKAHLKSLDDYGDRYGGNPNYDEDKWKEYGRKSDDFRKAAQDAFQRDYGFDNGNYYTGFKSSMYGSETRAPGGGYFPYRDDSRLTLYNRGEQCPIGDKPIDDISYHFEKPYMKKDVTDKYDAAQQELKDYKRGNYDYQKGKGWVKK